MVRILTLFTLASLSALYCSNGMAAGGEAVHVQTPSSLAITGNSLPSQGGTNAAPSDALAIWKEKAKEVLATFAVASLAVLNVIREESGILSQLCSQIRADQRFGNLPLPVQKAVLAAKQFTVAAMNSNFVKMASNLKVLDDSLYEIADLVMEAKGNGSSVYNKAKIIPHLALFSAWIHDIAQVGQAVTDVGTAPKKEDAAKDAQRENAMEDLRKKDALGLLMNGKGRKNSKNTKTGAPTFRAWLEKKYSIKLVSN